MLVLLSSQKFWILDKMRISQVRKALKDELMCVPYDWFHDILKDCKNVPSKVDHITEVIMDYIQPKLNVHACIPISYSERLNTITLSIYYKNSTRIMFEFGSNTRHSFTFHGTMNLENWLGILERIENSQRTDCILKIGI